MSISRGSKAKKAITRAKIAADIIKNYKRFDRGFDDCFEMGDGNEVVKHITEMARTDRQLASALLDRKPLGDVNGSLERLNNACYECLGRI